MLYNKMASKQKKLNEIFTSQKKSIPLNQYDERYIYSAQALYKCCFTGIDYSKTKGKLYKPCLQISPVNKARKTAFALYIRH